MAQIIDFPRAHQPLLWKFASKRSRILQALKFLFKNLTAKDLQPKRMIVIYEIDDSDSVFYLNLGYRPEEFRRALHEVLPDIVKHPDNWE